MGAADAGDYSALVRVLTWVAALLATGPRLPREVELAAQLAAIDWPFWSGVPAVRDRIEMRTVEVYPGYVAPCWALREG